jgi:hypothetical protein
MGLIAGLVLHIVGMMSKVVKPNVHAAALFGRLRELATRCQNFRDIVLSLSSQELPLPVDSSTRDELRAGLFEEALLHSCQNFDCIVHLINEIYGIFQEDGLAYAAYGDSLGRIKIAWDQVEVDWHRVVTTQSIGCSRQLSQVSVALDSITYDCCEITIPEKVQEHLKLLPIGGSLNFRDAYAKELNTEEGRRRFLSYLKFYPKFVDGLIDSDNETIIRAAPAGWRRVSTLLFAGALVLAGFALIFIACWLGTFASLAEWPFTMDRVRNYGLTYLFLIMGSTAHVVVTLLKQDRSASLSSQVLSDWILRIHVRETAFYISALSLCCGSLAVPFLYSKGISWQTAFFIGYSYDSFIDLFLRRFEGAASASALKDAESKGA